MYQPDITTKPISSQNLTLNFTLIIAGKTIQKPQPKEQTIFVHCDLCAENAEGTRTELLGEGWGITKTSAFCRYHEEMI